MTKNKIIIKIKITGELYYKNFGKISLIYICVIIYKNNNIIKFAQENYNRAQIKIMFIIIKKFHIQNITLFIIRTEL